MFVPAAMKYDLRQLINLFMNIILNFFWFIYKCRDETWNNPHIKLRKCVILNRYRSLTLRIEFDI